MEASSTILIVDDEKGTVDILAIILQNAGYNIITDTTGELNFLLSGEMPDLILLDNQLGARSGLSICYQLKQNEHTRHIPVILVSGMDNLNEMANHACADDHLSKPFCMQTLLNKIEVQLSKRHSMLSQILM